MYMRGKSLHIICILLMIMVSCRNDKNRNVPPVIEFGRVRVIDSLALPIDTVYQNVSSVAVHSGARVDLFCQTEAEGKYEQMDLVVYGMAKDVNGLLLDTAYLVNSLGIKTPLVGNASLDWPNTSFRNGFINESRDSMSVVFPKVTNKTTTVISVSDRHGLMTGQSFVITVE